MLRSNMFVILSLLFLCLNVNAQNNQLELSRSDVDSIGDLWIFTFDKTASMSSEIDVTGAVKTFWSPTQIKNDVIKKLSKKGGILDQIDYSHDRITIMETGYGNKETDSYGYAFRAALPLDSSFIHVIQFNKYYTTRKKSGVQDVLSTILEKNNYNYRESFVSQIRVLSLHRLIKLIHQENLGLQFKKIHIVTITDDADVNDQWKMDYYTMKRDTIKMRQLNELHSKYVYNSFTQSGGGYLDECVEFTDVSSKNHIYMYDYVTRQQKTSQIVCTEDSIVQIYPLDGQELNVRIKQNQINSEKISFVYIDTITINGKTYPVHQYIGDNLNIKMSYEIEPIYNKIDIQGKVQVQYNDSIYGLHCKQYDFVQHNNDYTSQIHSIMGVITAVLVIVILLALLYVFWIYPNRILLTVYVPNGRKLCIRRGFHWQWERLIPLVYCNRDKLVFANHVCFKKVMDNATSQESFKGIIIDSPVSLTFTSNVLSDTTKNNICRNAQNSHGLYSDALLDMYKKTWAGRFSALQNSRIKWVRTKLYPTLNKLIFRINPHYYYWSEEMSGLISTPILRECSFLIEYQQEIQVQTTDDKWLNTYYQGDYPVADVLICSNCVNNCLIWDVYQLCSQKILGYGISSVKHLIHYIQEEPKDGELNAITECLKRAIRREIGLNRIVSLSTINNELENIHFNVVEASCMAYVCLVEHTEEENCQIIYSPLTDTDNTDKNIVITASSVSRLIWTSLVPFTSKKDRPLGNIAHCESLYIVREGPTCQKMLSLRNKTIELDNIKVKSTKI